MKVISLAAWLNHYEKLHKIYIQPTRAVDISCEQNTHPKVTKKSKQRMSIMDPHTFLNSSGPTSVLRKSNGCSKSNFILPGGSESGGKLFGESLPSPLVFVVATFTGRISMLRQTYPWIIGLLALSRTNGL